MQVIKKALTKGELDALVKRTTEIEETLKMCDPRRDGDVIEGLDRELTAIIERLSEALKTTQESKLILRRIK